MQKDISIKTQENAKLERDIDSLNSETKSLHEQFKQNKEITERYEPFSFDFSKPTLT